MQALKDALEAVDWKAEVAKFLATPDVPAEFDAGSLRLAIWSKQLEQSDAGNPALVFVRGMQVAAQNVVILAALALYKASAGSLRSIFENALYYSYFRSHPTELASLVRTSTYFIDKAYVIEFYKLHIPDFGLKQEKVGLLTDISQWYKSVSAIVHGQKPGAWTTATAISDIELDPQVLLQLAEEFTECVKIVDNLMKVCVAPDLWDGFSKTAKRALLKGTAGDLKTVLNLDTA